MTTQQKDVLVNKIMVYITAAFCGTILWYVMYSLMQSSLITTGYYISLGIAAVLLVLGFVLLLVKSFRKRMVNAPSYARMSFICAVLFLILWTPYVARSLGFTHALSRIALLSSINACARFTLLLSYVLLAIAIIINIIVGCVGGKNQNVPVAEKVAATKGNKKKRKK